MPFVGFRREHLKKISIVSLHIVNMQRDVAPQHSVDRGPSSVVLKLRRKLGIVVQLCSHLLVAKFNHQRIFFLNSVLFGGNDFSHR